MSTQTITHNENQVSILANVVTGAKAQVIFAHGAGANMTHEFMDEITKLLNGRNINVLRFNFPYMDRRALLGKKYPPDRMPKLLDCYQQVIEYVQTQDEADSLPLFIGGKSMGSRAAASLLSKEQGFDFEHASSINGVFCLGYPFHPAKNPEKLRLAPFQLATKPVLIVQGERDTLGSKAEIDEYSLSDLCQCVFLEDGDHSLKPRVKSGFTYQQHLSKAAEQISLFIDKHL